MKKDILLAVISEAIDKGAFLHVHLTPRQSNKEEALSLAVTTSEALGGEVKERTLEGYGNQFVVDTTFMTFAFGYLEEDVDLTGSDFDDREAI